MGQNLAAPGSQKASGMDEEESLPPERAWDKKFDLPPGPQPAVGMSRDNNHKVLVGNNQLFILFLMFLYVFVCVLFFPIYFPKFEMVTLRRSDF